MPRGLRSNIRATAGGWSLRPHCPLICRRCSTRCLVGRIRTVHAVGCLPAIVKRTDMDKAAVPHQIRKVFEGRVFSVAVESITTRKGGNMDIEVVRHPGSVVLIPITAEGSVILVRQYRHAIGRWAWELPAGTLKPNEERRKAASRECHEEIGLLPAQLE